MTELKNIAFPGDRLRAMLQAYENLMKEAAKRGLDEVVEQCEQGKAMAEAALRREMS